MAKKKKKDQSQRRRKDDLQPLSGSVSNVAIVRPGSWFESFCARIPLVTVPATTGGAIGHLCAPTHGDTEGSAFRLTAPGETPLSVAFHIVNFVIDPLHLAVFLLVAALLDVSVVPFVGLTPLFIQ